jgi:hypothetical protein
MQTTSKQEEEAKSCSVNILETGKVNSRSPSSLLLRHGRGPCTLNLGGTCRPLPENPLSETLQK